jgi:hypothetical protein
LTFKKFYIRCLLFSAILAAAFVLFNVCMDEFGLFGKVKGRHIRIYTSEKASKYLLSYRYIPENFDALIIGPSLSDQLDPRKINGYKVYNLSILMGNASEVRLMADNVLNRGHIRLLILCLHPYLTKDSILWDKRMRPESRLSVLGSTFTFKFYNDKLKSMLNPKNDSFSESWSGYSRPIHKKGISTEAFIDNFVALVIRGNGAVGDIDPTAFAQLKELVQLARERGAHIFAYYHPVPFKVLNACEPAFRRYQQQINTLFDGSDLVWDFNTPEYDSFRKNTDNYIDHGHLSFAGADFVVGELNRLLAGWRR